MADFNAQALLQMSREELISLVVNYLNLTTADAAEKMRDDEIVHMVRMNLDDDYQKQVSSVSKTNSKKPANKKAPVKKTSEAKSSTNEKTTTDKPSKPLKKSVKSNPKKEENEKASEEVKEIPQDVKTEEVKPEEKVVLKEPVKKTSKRTTKRKETNKEVKEASKEEKKVEPNTEVKASEELTVSEAKPEEIKEPSKSKRTSRKTKKEEVSLPEVVSTNEENISAKENLSEDNNSEPKKKPSRKNKKSVKDTNSEVKEEVAIDVDKKEDSTEEVPSDTKTDKKPKSKRNKKPAKTTEPSEVSKEDTNNTEATPDVSEVNTNDNASNNEAKPKNNPHKKPQRRTISFGPGVGLKVEATAEVNSESNEVALNPTEENQEVQAPQEPEIQLLPVAGVLSIGAEKNDYCGFLHANNYLPGDSDSYVSGQLIKRMGLRKGDYITGLATPPRGKGNPPLKQILTINGIDVSADDFDFDTIRKRKKFENLTAIYPDEKLVLETGKDQYSTRIIDIICPIGKGQRGMVVSPPKAGKTVLLKKIANAITANDPKCKLIVLLIDERPEEVTDMQRSINGEVVYSTFDKKPENHVRVTELVLERAMRLVEMDEDVVILLDSMTRLARAYNLTITPTGRTLSGGLDPGSLYGPKRFFGAARNIENGGSLTIISTSLIETGSRMDEVIFEEFKGTGNMEVVLDRKLADRRVFPAIAVDKSGTRREDLLLSPEELDAVWKLRKRIADFDTVVATDLVIKLMERTPNNKVFVDTVIKKFDEADSVK